MRLFIFIYLIAYTFSSLDIYSADLKPRPPLKRTRKMLEEEPQSRAVNGSKETKRLTERDDGGMGN